MLERIQTQYLAQVMIATSGAQLLPEDAVRLLRQKLLPMTTILTPNIPEATLLLRDADIHFEAPEDLESAQSVAKKVHSLGPKAVLLKGGHMPLTEAYKRPNDHEEPSLIVDILYDGTEFTFIESQYRTSRNTHGTGCSLASAIAANLASHQTVATAVRNACRYIEAGITTSHDLGLGNGPINHFHSLQRLSFAPGRFFEYLLDRPDVKHLWKAFTQHEFLQRLGDGTLPTEAFKHFLVQDYLYLVNFARMGALSAYKSKTIDGISASSHFVLHIEEEMALHLAYCKEFGLSKEKIEGEKESLANIAYSRWLLDIGQSEDWIALQMALASCSIGYGVSAQLLQADVKTKRVGNPFYKWVESYIADDYQETVRSTSGRLINFTDSASKFKKTNPTTQI
jgi:hydroxymethylpyrimidine kinase/phosphomethylpyrimidine kinase